MTLLGNLRLADCKCIHLGDISADAQTIAYV